MKQRRYYPWVDVAKGLGIISVVYGHMYSGFMRDFVFLFHMPLFFFLGGYLSKGKTDYPAYLKEKVRHLLLPYFLYLIILSPFSQLLDKNVPIPELVRNAIYGGYYLVGWFAVFWFVTCFFVTQQLFNWCLTKLPHCLPVIASGSLLLAYVNSCCFPSFRLPWALNIVLYAFPLFYMGYLFKHKLEHLKYCAPVIVVLVLLSVLSFCYEDDNRLDMKATQYGIFPITFLSGLSLVCGILLLSKVICRIPCLSQVFQVTGKASMTIMFLHQCVHFLVLHQLNVPTCVMWLLSILVPLLCHYLYTLFSPVFRRL